MNILFRLVVFILCSTFSLFAQDFQGVATYKTQRKLDIKIDSTQMGGGEMQKQIMDMLKKEFQKTYILSFDKNTSIYKEDEALAPPSSGGSMMVVSSMGGSGVLFKDIKNQSFTNQIETFGKQFIVKDSLKPIKWTLNNETKNIGDYTCYKATYTKEIEEMSMKTFSSSDTKSNENEANSSPKMKTITVTAWYTPQISVSNGPERYQGLPGLILEVNDGDLTILCSKITFNPKKSIDLSEPKKGKQVTQQEYDDIVAKKIEEMNEQYNGRSSDKSGFKIHIGG
jgi:GLPGLI family protein